MRLGKDARRRALALPILTALATTSNGLGGLAAVQAATTEVVVSGADAYVAASQPSSAFGTSGSLWVDGSPQMQTYLKFSVPATGAVTRATLQLYVTRSSEAFEVRAVPDSSWTESGLTFANAPASSGGAVRSGVATVGAWSSVDVTSLVPSSGTVTLAVTPISATSQAFSSREAGSAVAPRLQIERQGTSTDTQPPTVSLTGPASGSTFLTAQSVHVAAAASDNVGVTRVEFFDNGVYQGTEDTAPFGYTWSVISALNGSHRWTARAYDAAGNSTLSSPVDVTVAVPTGSTSTVPAVPATAETTPVPDSGDAADDVAIWVHPTDPSKSTVIGTNKLGGLAVYGLDGKQLHYYTDSKPNNVDIRYNFPLGGRLVTLVVTSDKTTNALRAYTVDPATRGLQHVSARTLSVGIGLYGLCMYHSPASGKYYAFDSDSSGTLQQWELYDNAGKVDARKVRQITVGSTTEGCVADDETGAFYLAEEDVAIWRYSAEPDGGTTRTRVDAVGAGRLVADVEGLSLYYARGGRGYLVASSQGSNNYALYSREAPNSPVGRFTVGAGSLDAVSYTDGLDVTNVGLGAAFPEGAFIAQDDRNDSGNQNFKLVPWGSIARAGSGNLLIDTSWDPRAVGAVASVSSVSSSLSSSATTSLTASVAPAAATAAVQTYYVNSVSGSDSNAGTSPDRPWKTLSKANAVSLLPGDSLLLSRGGSWTGTLAPKGSGTSTTPITVGAYGSGAAPIVRGSSTCLRVAGSRVVVRDLEIRACSWAGIEILGSGNRLEGNFVTDSVAGVYLKPSATDNAILRNRLVDNKRMSVLTPGGSDDSGAFGVLLRGDRNEIAYNEISGSDAFSYDYGRDGAAVEVYGGIGNHIHHNIARNNDAFSELGDKRSADNVFAYNEVRSSLATSVFVVTRGAGSGYGPVLGTRLLNNTVHFTGASSQGFVCHSGCSSDILTMRNNVIQAVAKAGFADAPFDEANGLYFGGVAQFKLGPNSLVANPQFVNGATGDLRLSASSPAVDRGAALPQYQADVRGLAVPLDGNGDGVARVDLGANELRA